MANNNDAALEQELAGLRREYERLKNDQVRAEEQVRSLSERIQELKTQAKAEFGTDNPAELERILAEKREENSRLVRQYREHLNSVNKGLSEIEDNARKSMKNGNPT